MLKRRKAISIFILVACLFSYSNVFSQTDSSAALTLDPVTVTASVNPMQISRTGRNIMVIKGEEFKSLPVHSIDELLRYIPGIEVQLRGSMGAQSDIVMRGGTFQQVLIILDGMRLNDPNTGHFNSYIPIAPAEIERIEVLKGASSAIYGSDAVGGVIHIITHSFGARQGATKKQFDLQGSAGEYDLFSANAGGFYQKDKTMVSGGMLTNNTNGQPQRGTRGYLNNHTASVSFSQFLGNRWKISLRSAFDQRDFSAQNFYTSFTSDTANEKVSSFWNQFQLSYKDQNQSWTFDIGYKNVDDHYLYNSGSLANDNKSKLLQTLLKNERRINDQTTLTTGIQLINKKIKSNDRGDHSLDQAAGFIVLNSGFNEKLFLSPAMRMDWNERSGWELVPQINVSYHLNSFQLRGSAGKTIRDADFTERFNNYNKALVTGGRIGNPGLEAERSFSYELGADFHINKYFKISTTLFSRRHSKLIDWDPTVYTDMPRKENLSPGGTYALAKNISKVITTGAEMDLQYAKQLNENSRLWALAGITWLDSKSSNSTPSFYISSHARFMTNFSIQYTCKRIGINVNGLYKIREPQTASAIHAEIMKDYFLMNAKAEYFLLKNKGLFIQLENILDNNGQDVLGSQLPGRWFSAGFNLHFGK